MKRRCFLFFAMLIVGCQLYAQQSTITGVVTAKSDGEPIIGANILLKSNKSIGTITDINGAYNIKGIKGDDILVFSCIGYETMEIKVKSEKKVYNIVMNEDNELLDEVVVVGYGTMKRSDLTGSVSSLKDKDLLSTNPISLEQGMQGRLAGVNVIKNDGAPGGGISMQIRGTNSFLGGTDPLYVIDGVPMTTSNSQETISFDSNEVISRNALAFLDPSDIESIEVLKDGSSIAIYGSQGANGVVMITTKSGREGKSQLKLDYGLTISSVAKKLDLLGAREYAEYRNISANNTNLITSGKPLLPESLPFPGIEGSEGEYLRGPEDFDNDPYYWQNAIFRTALTHNYSLSYSGGNNKTDYIVSAAYLDQEGTIKNSNYQRANIKININSQVISVH